MNGKLKILGGMLEATFDAFEKGVERFSPQLSPRYIGQATYIGKGIAHVTGLPGVKSEEVLGFPGGLKGLALNIDPGKVGTVLLGDYGHLRSGDEVQRTDRVLDVPVGEELLGRVVDPTGKERDEGNPISTYHRRPVERIAPRIIDRAPVTIPLQTGIKVIDALIPIGRGQRQLILGDRQTGKTAIATDTIVNQKDKGVLCFYCAIGQRTSNIARVIARLTELGAMEYTTVVIAEADDPPGVQFIAPYAVTSMAEFFMEKGRDILIVYDDLTRHARAYREISLLLRRPPGREAFPGDIFYIHSRLLERATHLREELGGGTLTAFPIIETEGQNLSAYIPTNLISITDGQIYLSPQLFRKGLLPAIDVGLSVSRVGGKAQLPAYRAVAGDLRLSYSQFEELEAFARFGTRLDEATRKTLRRGRRVRSILKQEQFAPVPAAEQVLILHAVNQGLFDSIDEEDMDKAEDMLRRAISNIPEIAARIAQGRELSKEDLHLITQISRKAIGEGV
jgi:F-type H+-transporting ATPase subunit alpha